MPVNHSSLNGWSGPVACGSALLPLHTKVKGPAASLPSDQQDIIDEALSFYRANVLFKNFQPQGAADLTLAYLTVYIGEVLRFCQKYKTKEEARKAITSISMSTTFSIPGDKSFPFPGFFTNPANKTDADAFKTYYRQLREECANRVLDVAYIQGQQAAEQTHNKWWMAFSKRKFMNITQT